MAGRNCRIFKVRRNIHIPDHGSHELDIVRANPHLGRYILQNRSFLEKYVFESVRTVSHQIGFGCRIIGVCQNGIGIPIIPAIREVRVAIDSSCRNQKIRNRLGCFLAVPESAIFFSNGNNGFRGFAIVQLELVSNDLSEASRDFNSLAQGSHKTLSTKS